eukprot:TRINITY_DN5155_c0_g1_i1.p1 TRINITY_DN5155_c0_g1~~TRINITY_DN5155_c0_g1_i1.p1  ORF type:complete len:965 (+),score=251.36 TRINITY_DN5155_c0_g1_i1:102-2996(+)
MHGGQRRPPGVPPRYRAAEAALQPGRSSSAPSAEPSFADPADGSWLGPDWAPLSAPPEAPPFNFHSDRRESGSDRSALRRNATPLETPRVPALSVPAATLDGMDSRPMRPESMPTRHSSAPPGALQDAQPGKQSDRSPSVPPRIVETPPTAISVPLQLDTSPPLVVDPPAARHVQGSIDIEPRLATSVLDCVESDVSGSPPADGNNLLLPPRTSPPADGGGRRGRRRSLTVSRPKAPSDADTPSNPPVEPVPDLQNPRSAASGDAMDIASAAEQELLGHSSLSARSKRALGRPPPLPLLGGEDERPKEPAAITSLRRVACSASNPPLPLWLQKDADKEPLGKTARFSEDTVKDNPRQTSDGVPPPSPAAQTTTELVSSFGRRGAANAVVDSVGVSTRRRRERGLSTLSNIGVSKTSVLRQSGIDMVLLKRAVTALSKSDGSLDLTQFRSLWKNVFPGRPMDADSWRNIERMFKEIDEDGSQAITFDELILYLERRRREELNLMKRPECFREWVWQFCTTNVATDWKVDSKNNDSCVVTCIYVWKAASQVMVLTSIVVLMIESMPDMQVEGSGLPGNKLTHTIEQVCAAFFTLEFVGWVYSYTPRDDEEEDEQEEEEDDDDGEGSGTKHPPKCNRMRALLSEPTTWIDFLSILPFYLNLLPSGDTESAAPLAAVRLARLLRLLRIFRVLKIGKGKFGRAPELGAALKKSLISLNFLLTLVVIAMALSASFVFYAETDEATFNMTLQLWIRDADSKYDDAGRPTMFQSIPHSLWWGIVTLTTVGYGDLFPVTAGGKVIASLTMLAGLIVVGFPITILTSTFQAMEEQREAKESRMQLCREFYKGMRLWVHRLSQDPSVPGQNSSPTRATHSPSSADGDGGNQALYALQSTLNRLALDLPGVVRSAEQAVCRRMDKLEARVDGIEKRMHEYIRSEGSTTLPMHIRAVHHLGSAEPNGPASPPPPVQS